MKFKTDLGLLILRLTLGVNMLFHGIAKIQNGAGGIGKAFASKGLPEFFSYGVYLGEVIAPIMIIAGFRTKMGSLLISATMVVAILLKHSDDIFALGSHGSWGIELQSIYLFAARAILP